MDDARLVCAVQVQRLGAHRHPRQHRAAQQGKIESLLPLRLFVVPSLRAEQGACLPASTDVFLLRCPIIFIVCFPVTPRHPPWLASLPLSVPARSYFDKPPNTKSSLTILSCPVLSCGLERVSWLTFHNIGATVPGVLRSGRVFGVDEEGAGHRALVCGDH